MGAERFMLGNYQIGAGKEAREEIQREEISKMIYLRGGGKILLTLDGGSEDRRERAEDLIAYWNGLGIAAKRIDGFAIEIGGPAALKQEAG